MKKFKSYRLRFLVMLAVLVVVAVGYFTAAGIGNVCGIGFESITLLCPLGALLAMIAERTTIPLAVVSVIVVLAVCIVLGKVFCSWVCPVHFMSRKDKKKEKCGDAAAIPATSPGAAPPHGAADATPVSPDSIPAPPHGAADSPTGSPIFLAVQEGGLPAQKGEKGGALAATAEAPTTSAPLSRAERASLGGCATCAAPCGKSKGIKIDSRHGILAAALGSTLIFGFPVFCLVCPVGLTFATVLLVMRLFAFGDTTWTVVAFPLIIALEILLLPKWCQRFCPLGALLSLFSGLNRTFRPQVNAETCLREGQGKACNLCEQVCPEGINLHDIAAGETTLNDCSKCRACADVCPEHAITFPLLLKKQGAAVGVGAPVLDDLEVSDVTERG